MFIVLASGLASGYKNIKLLYIAYYSFARLKLTSGKEIKYEVNLTARKTQTDNKTKKIKYLVPMITFKLTSRSNISTSLYDSTEFLTLCQMFLAKFLLNWAAQPSYEHICLFIKGFAKE